MAAKLIRYECVAREHQPTLTHLDKLTVHQGDWAFCPFDAHAEGHRWRDTGGSDLETVQRRFGLSPLPQAAEETRTARS